MDVRNYDYNNPNVVVGGGGGVVFGENARITNSVNAGATSYEPLATSTPSSHFAFTVTAGPALPVTNMMSVHPSHMHVGGLSPSSMSPSVSVSSASAAASQQQQQPHHMSSAHRPGGASTMSLYHVNAMGASNAGAVGSGGTSSPSATNSSSGGPNAEQPPSHLFGMMSGMGTSPHPSSLPANLLFVSSGVDMRMGSGGSESVDGHEYNFSWNTNM